MENLTAAKPIFLRGRRAQEATAFVPEGGRVFKSLPAPQLPRPSETQTEVQGGELTCRYREKRVDGGKEEVAELQTSGQLTPTVISSRGVLVQTDAGQRRPGCLAADTGPARAASSPHLTPLSLVYHFLSPYP